jgi:putative N6-adenine-specific DNA methylase
LPFFCDFAAYQRGAFFMERFFATCPRGLELLLAEELRQLKAEKIHAVGGGVQFGGDFFL